MPTNIHHHAGRVALALLTGTVAAGCLAIRDVGKETTGQGGAGQTSGGQTSSGQTTGVDTTGGETSGGQTGGWVGGAQISCTPLAIAFSQTIDHHITTVPVLCTNMGSGANLMIDPPTASPAVFAAQFDENSYPYPLNGLAPGQTVQIDVSYAPSTSSNDEGTLLIKSNSGQSATLEIPLTGQGLDVPPCQFVISPSQLNFGDVQVGDTSIMLSVEIQNVGVDICFVQGLGQLTDGFSLVSTSIAPDLVTAKIAIPPPEAGMVSSLTIQMDLTCTVAGPVSTQFTIAGQTCVLSATCG